MPTRNGVKLLDFELAKLRQSRFPIEKADADRERSEKERVDHLRAQRNPGA